MASAARERIRWTETGPLKDIAEADSPALLAALKRWIVCDLAGPSAEAIFLRPDFSLADDAAAISFCTWGCSDCKRAFEHWREYQMLVPSCTYEGLVRLALRVVFRHWAAIEKLANVLMDRHVLSYRETLQVLLPFLPKKIAQRCQLEWEEL